MTKRILCMILAITLALGIFTLPSFAETTDETDYSYTEADMSDYDYKVYDPIPLLVLVVSFDANGNGIDDLKAGNNVTSTTSGCFGEQWAYTKESYWANEYFGEKGKTLNTFYKYNSHGSFYWVPVEETYGIENNGVIYVTVNMVHPNATGGKTTANGSEKYKALEEAAKYMDFEKYDKDGNGYLDYTELTVSYIIAGYNTKFCSSATAYQKFGLHNFMLSSGTGVKIGNVTVLNGSKGARYIYDGECGSSNTGIKYGSPAHELGHVLGARDMYTASGYTWCGGPGDIALNGGGSYLSYSGETKGTSPSAIDPYYQYYYGFTNPIVASDGEYTLYSKESKKGDYNIIRVNTANPQEYYLIENRYYGGTDTFDAIAQSAKAIQIWHVDETIMDAYTWVNCYKGTPHNPGNTPLYQNGATGGSGYNGWDPSDGVFEAKNYKFVASETWYTLMTEEEAKELENLKIEVISSTSTETKIRISGTVQYGPFINCYSTNDSVDSVTVKGSIKSLNGSTLTNLKLELSKSKDFNTIEGTAYAKPDSKGEFSFSIGDLSPKTNFFYRLTATSNLGDTVTIGSAITKALPKVRTDDYMVYLYQFKTQANRPYEKVVKFGQELTYGFDMTMSLAKFAGWYYDMEYTQKYDMATVKYDTNDVYLYAKWINNEDAVTFKIVDATLLYEMYAYSVGEAIDEPRIADREGYTFEGWYIDEDYKTEFSFLDGVDEAGEVTLYAKWVSNDAPATEEPIDIETTSPVETTSAVGENTTESGTTPSEPGKTNVTVIIVIVVAVVVVAVVVVLLIIKSKKKK